MSELGYAVTRRFRADLEDLVIGAPPFRLIRALATAKALPSRRSAKAFTSRPAASSPCWTSSKQRGLCCVASTPLTAGSALVELTDAGQAVLERAVQIGIAIEAALCQGFEPDQRESLISNLQKVAGNIGLTLGVHPGYRGDEGDGRTREKRPETE